MKIPKKPTLAPALAALLALNLSAGAALAELTPAGVQKVIKDAKLWGDAHAVNVACTGTEVIIATYKDKSENDQDCKIDAILITRKIQAADPEVTKVVLRFYDTAQPHTFKQVEVRQTDIAAFAKKLVDDKTLLSGISITQQRDRVEVVPGPFGEERAAIKQHIGDLQAQGVGIANYMRLFSDIEEMATKADQEAKDAKRAAEAGAASSQLDDSDKDSTLNKMRAALNTLLQALDKQEQAIRQAKMRPGQHVVAVGGMMPPSSLPPAESGGTMSLGIFLPASGPLMYDRILLGQRLNELKKKKISVDPYIPLWIQMDSHARKNDDRSVHADVEFLDKQVGLPVLTDAERARHTVVNTGD